MEISRIFEIDSQDEFESLSIDIFGYQYKNTLVYREFCDFLGVSPEAVTRLDQIPFLPIEFFKSRKVISQDSDADTCFKSSGTTNGFTSEHYLADLNIYKKSFHKAFESFYGHVGDYCILALLPSYLERKDSSLIFMVSELIEKSGHPKSGFYLSDYERLAQELEQLEEAGTPILLIGVTFALLDMASRFKMSLRNTIVMETGGMKGRKKEMVREEVHSILKQAWGLSKIHSEYGMTELLSQAYSKDAGLFHCPPWMRVLIRDPEDPLRIVSYGISGGINVIDLANIYSCSFLATQDLGKLHENGEFEVLGRFDHSDIRGCNLMVM